MSGGFWGLELIERPFGGRESLYTHLQRHVLPGRRGLAPGGETLPDEPEDDGQGGIRFVAGGLDGVMGHHVGVGEAQQEVDELLAALRETLTDATRFQGLYERLAGAQALGVVDPLLAAIQAASPPLDPERLARLAGFLCREAPDREPLKLGIALLGLSPLGDEDRDVLLVLGRHEELTLFAAVALGNAREEGELLLWELAEHVTGWGRIHLVERLAATEDPRIQRWLLREGFRNDVMYEYLAHTCATAGRLLEALQAAEVDDELLGAAGELIQALLAGAGGPAQGMDDYEDGAEVVGHYLRHVRGAARPRLEHFLVAKGLEHFLAGSEGAQAAERVARGWTAERLARSSAELQALFAREVWGELVRQGLSSDESREYQRATDVARRLGIDTFEVRLARLRDGRDDTGWYWLLKTTDPERLERLLALADERIDLEQIATGPARSAGFGPAFRPHATLDWVLQELGRFPGRGWRFLRAALLSPSVRNRNMAHKALAEWGAAAWPAEARARIEAALELEPDDAVAGRMRRLLAGLPLEEPRPTEA